MYFPPDENRMQDNAERLMDRKGAPPKRPGDEYTIAGTFIGIIAGAMIAGAAGGEPWMFLVGLIGGGIAGTYAGSLVGPIVIKHRKPGNDLK